MAFDYYKVLYTAQSWNVKGFKLKPLTLGNLILFELLQLNAIKYKPTDELTLNDLVNLIIICTRPYKDSIRLYSKNWFQKIKYNWLYKKYSNQIAKAGKDDIDKFVFEFFAEVKKYYEYYLDNIPSVIESLKPDINKKTSSKATPVPIQLFFDLLRIGIPINSIYNIPFNSALTYKLIELESNGILQLNPLDNGEYSEFLKAIELADANPKAFIDSINNTKKVK